MKAKESGSDEKKEVGGGSSKEGKVGENPPKSPKAQKKGETAEKSPHKINVRSGMKRKSDDNADKEPKTTAESKTGAKPFHKSVLAGYTPPYRVKEKTSDQKPDEPEKPRKVYTLEFCFSMRKTNKERPGNMAELNFPHKKKGTNVNGFRKKPLTDKDKFNKTVGEIRQLLNKLSASNFDTISKKLLDFTYDPSLLYEFMKMIFIKSTGEHYYLDVYVELCAKLFKRFNDKENYEMNFKKLLVNKCQKQFFKMLNREREERKKRKDSMTEVAGLGKEGEEKPEGKGENGES